MTPEPFECVQSLSRRKWVKDLLLSRKKLWLPHGRIISNMRRLIRHKATLGFFKEGGWTTDPGLAQQFMSLASLTKPNAASN